MQDQEFNQFAKYQAFSTYETKTKQRNIDTRSPLQFYQQNNISTKNWDSTLLENKVPVHRELDKITSLVDSLFIRTENNSRLVEEERLMNSHSQLLGEQDKQNKVKQSLTLSTTGLLESAKSLEQLQLQSSLIHNQKIQSLANTKAALLDIAMNYTSFCPKQPISSMYNLKTDLKKTVEQKGCQLKQSAPLTLYELRQIRDIEIQKALTILQK